MSAPALRPSPRDRRRAGAIQYAVPAALILTMIVGALAVDVGRMSWNKRELQSIADIAAIDAMREFGQCRETLGDPIAAAQASAARNGYPGDLTQPPNVVEVGGIASVGGVREFTAGGPAATATAVRVFATRSVPFTLIAGAFLPGQASLSAEAVATREAYASIQAGSFAARVDSDDSELLDQVFGGLLGGNVAVDALGYERLLGATLSVGDLVTAAGVGGVDELLALQLPANQYLELVADAVADGGNAAAAAVLNDVAAVADGSRVVEIAAVRDVVPGAGAPAREALLNAFDMLDVGAQVAVGDNAVVIDPLAATVPGVASTSMRLRIVQSPRIAVGPPGRDADGAWLTSVRTGQVRMALEIRLLNGIALLGPEPLNVDVFVEGAPTVAHLDAIDCADADDPVHRVVVGAEPGLVRLGIGHYPNFDTSPDPVPSELVSVVVPLPLLPDPTVKVTAAADVPFQSSPQDLRYDGPFRPAIDEVSEDNTQTVGTPLGDGMSNALSSLLSQTTLDVEVLGGGLPVAEGEVLTAASDLLGPVLTQLDGPMTSLFAMLGIHVGGADVTVLSLNADQPSLAR